MGILIVLAIWLLVLIGITYKFRRDGDIGKQRLFSVFVIIWAILAIAYYDVLMLTTGQFDAGVTVPWYSYVPVVCFSVCAGVGTYFLMMTFRKFHKEKDDNGKKKKSKKPGKKSGKKK